MNNAWWKDAVVYQIYPKSFNGYDWKWYWRYSRNYSKFDYLKELGIDVIWLTPVYQSPQHDNGYDISDYYSIDERFGTMEDFEELLEEP